MSRNLRSSTRSAEVADAPAQRPRANTSVYPLIGGRCSWLRSSTSSASHAYAYSLRHGSWAVSISRPKDETMSV